MEISCVVIDDERHAVDVIETFIRQTRGLIFQAGYTDPLRALDELRKKPADLAFIDVDMAAVNGLTLAEKLPVSTTIVFTTSYREYAVEAYAIAAADYLLKPISYERFLQCIERIKERLAPALNPPQLFVKDHRKGKNVPVLLEEITYISAALNYLELHFQDTKILLYGGLTELKSRLPENFVRIHRSYVINTAQIRTKAATSVTLNCGSVIPVGRSYSGAFKKATG
ncbi:DNA-binding response regulator [Mucilaginibacter conchicola]|uniref:DNA-binding response regulator n=1 Tax=Mucilaginibacter conchicola TaxID=2303333 RepID=A0A372NUD5_9SPHI|nr:LytTR family DNA-binding domain-containing protein [Mucilaginibacter conchicola]RFZ92883.1 DNA-binding response regulator [Mucilaginibacter conchicola]